MIKITFLLLSLISYSLAGPIHIIKETHRPTKQIQIPRLEHIPHLKLHQHQQRSEISIIRPHEPSSPDEAPSRHSIYSRDWNPNSIVLKQTVFNAVTAIVPSTLLAARLEEFYDIIALQIENGDYGNFSPENVVSFTEWGLELKFYTNGKVIPLSFIQAWVIDMANKSANGFSGFYEAVVSGQGPLTGLFYLVQMRLKDKSL